MSITFWAQGPSMAEWEKLDEMKEEREREVANRQ